MKIGDLLANDPKDNPGGPVIDLDQTAETTETTAHKSAPVSPPSPPSEDPPPTLEELQSLAEEAIQATDIAREADAIAKAARRRLEEAMDKAKQESVIALGRECAIKTDKRPDVTLKSLTAVMGEKDAKNVWGKLPRKTSRHVEIPNALTVEPVE